jgi:hypothetical protein
MEFLVRSRDARVDPARMLPGARTVLVAAVRTTGDAGPSPAYARTLDITPSFISA